MITIVDYGLGNIQAFVNLYERLNIHIRLAKTANELQDASKIILPGVGAFDHAITLLENSGMRETLDKLVLQDKIPVLGICVGMQILANSSDEGILPGLGWIDGKVKKLAPSCDIGAASTDATSVRSKLPLPHMGWNNIKYCSDNNIFCGLDVEPRYYFLHSYYFECADINNSIATVCYGNNFTCAVNKYNIYGVQFHPEKSHHNGVILLKNFAKMES